MSTSNDERREILRSARKQAGKVEDLAERFGVSVRWLYRVEDGELPDEDLAEKMAEAYGVAKSVIGYRPRPVLPAMEDPAAEAAPATAEGAAA
jgi:transcriptional regulator with XRE-family HTH domain